MESGILIFNEAEDFIKFMEDLQEQYNKQHEGAAETNVKL